MSNTKKITITFTEDHSQLTIDYFGGVSQIEKLGIAEILRNDAVEKISQKNTIDTSNHQMD
jgi:stalled ribosome rescue protein Dom34